MNLCLRGILKCFAPILPFIFIHNARAESLGAAIDKIEQVNSMRESLAANLDPSKEPITETTFKNVCAPVGQAFASWAQSGGHVARQVSDRYRNAKNKATPSEVEVLEKFRRQSSQLFFVQSEKRGQEEGFQIFRRIDVQSSCLNCHGSAASLPEFIKKKYPQDLGRNFKAGDLRGMYSVWIKGASK